ncbi:hypothetical protein HYV81_05405 [Candidatus Woesearchaeota archaeon]|nr:hypothetical protein [Candidatus Woesearchaeota archaeon]
MVESVTRDIVQHRYQDIPLGNYIEAAPRFRVKYKDYFHMKNLYIMMREWLIEEGFVPRTDTEFNEELYLQREHQKAGEELWIWWRFIKKPHRGGNYWAYSLDIDFHVILLREVEVMHQGVKYKTNWGEPEIIMTARLIEDYEGLWRKNAFMSELHKIFIKRLFKKELESHRLELYREVYRLQEAIKTYFKLKTFLPEPELQKWWPQQGIGEVE